MNISQFFMFQYILFVLFLLCLRIQFLLNILLGGLEITPIIENLKLLFNTIPDIGNAFTLILLCVLFIRKFYGRVVYLLLFLEIFTLINLFSLSAKLSYWLTRDRTVFLYLFLSCVALEARLGLALLVNLSRNQNVTGIEIV